MQRTKQARGFTLLELLVVVVIVGILAALALPRMGGLIERARIGEALSNLGVLRASLDRWVSENGLPPTTVFADLDVQDPGLVTPRYFNYTISLAVPGTCDPVVGGDPTPDFWLEAIRTDLGNRPAPAAAYGVVLSSVGRLCDTL